MGPRSLHPSTSRVALAHPAAGGGGQGRTWRSPGELKVSRHTPALWRQRFIRDGLDAVWEIQSGRGRKPDYPPEKACGRDCGGLRLPNQNPKEPPIVRVAGRWRAASRSARTPSTASGKNTTSSRTGAGLSNSRATRKFLEKLTDVVGLYLNPPDKTLVLCVDEEKSDSSLGPEPSRACRSSRGRCGTFSPMTTCAMARPRSLPPWKFWKAKSSASVIHAIADRRSFLKIPALSG